METHGITGWNNVEKDDKNRVQNVLHGNIAIVKVEQESKLKSEIRLKHEDAKSIQPSEYFPSSASAIYCGYRAAMRI